LGRGRTKSREGGWYRPPQLAVADHLPCRCAPPVSAVVVATIAVAAAVATIAAAGIAAAAAVGCEKT